MAKTEELANEDSSDDLDSVQVDEDGLGNLDDDLDDVDDGGLDGDDDIDDESGEDGDVPEDEEDDEGTEPGRKEPEQPKEKGAFVVRDDDDDENLTPSRQSEAPRRSCGRHSGSGQGLSQADWPCQPAERRAGGGPLRARRGRPVRPASARYRERRHGLQAQARAQVGGERRQEGQGHLLEANLRLVVSLARSATPAVACSSST